MAELITAFLEQLESIKGDPQAQSALTAEFMLLNQPEAQREELRAALDAASVLRWFDAGLIAKVLDIPDAEAIPRVEFLKSLPVIEVYRSGNNELYNVHESTRLGWRKQLAQTHLQRFRDLSLRASASFAADLSASGRIEWIYQLLSGNPDQGATELANLNRAWTGSAHPEDLYSLASALKELEETKLVAGRARCWLLLVIAWVRVMRSETAQLGDMADEISQLAREYKDSAAEAEAQCLLGDINQAQGKLENAQAAYGNSMSILRRLLDQDPGNAGWQRELAAAHGRIGSVRLAWGKLDAAQAAYDQSLAISRRLADQDPGNAGWQRNLAMAHNGMGRVLQALGKLDVAQAAYDQSLAISRRLADQDRGNAQWQRELGVTLGYIGDVLQAQGKPDAAQSAFNEYLAIFGRLAGQDPVNNEWQSELQVTLEFLREVLEAQGNSDAAVALYAESLLATARSLADGEPGNPIKQYELAVAHVNVGDALQAQGKPDDAQTAFKESLSILQRLTELFPDIAFLQRDMQRVRSWLL